MSLCIHFRSHFLLNCGGLNFQFACNDLIVHNFVIRLTQIPLNDNDFMQFMASACEGFAARTLGLTIISCTTVALTPLRPIPPPEFSRGPIGFYRRTTLIKYQRNLLFKLSLSANKRLQLSVGGSYMAKRPNAEWSGGFCFSAGAWICCIINLIGMSRGCVFQIDISLSHKPTLTNSLADGQTN